MFSGIIEATSILNVIREAEGGIQVSIKKPNSFNDLNVGDSISVDGVCLTVESFDLNTVQFFIAVETIRVTNWSRAVLSGKYVNLERALKVDSRLHGHWVTGHVDTVSKVLTKKQVGESLIIQLKMMPGFKKIIWSKGSVTLNGVSLTVNEVTDKHFSVCLIPETLKVTNLKSLEDNDQVNIEFDYMARAVVNFMENSDVSLNSNLIFKNDRDPQDKEGYA